MEGELVRMPAVAGQFYDSNPKRLRREIEEYIKKAQKVEIAGEIIGLISPHAGYIYSGPIAAYSYKEIMGKPYKTVIVLAPSHRAYFKGVSIIPSGLYRTPLGDVPIDEEMVKKIASYDPNSIVYYPKAHQFEHSAEVQVPFLQVVLPKGWKIVPIVYGSSDFKTATMVAKAIAPHFKVGEDLIVASTDLSHYYPYDIAIKKDTLGLDLITNLDVEGLIESLASEKCEMCGRGPVLTITVFTKAMGGKAKLLKYANSGDTAGSKDQVVGYGAVAFYVDKSKINRENKKEETSEENFEKEFTVTEKQKKMLLSMARRTLEDVILHNKIPKFDEKDPLLDQKLGLFVTLRKGPREDLRGCIGHIFPIKPLREALPELTVASATQDPRFPPVRANELKDITIEISILSPLKRVKDWREIQIPGDGVYVKRGFRSGVFLPQVADETGWDRETFMRHLCVGKAGLPPDAWKDPNTELYVFRVIKFEEKPH